MAERTLVFTFEDDGQIQIEAVGFKGVGCMDATRPYEIDLYGKEGVSTPKEELRASAETQRQRVR